MLIGDGELIDMMHTAVILRMDHGITQAEINAMTCVDYELTKMMILNILTERTKKTAP